MMIGIGNSVYLAESAFRGGGWEGWGWESCDYEGPDGQAAVRVSCSWGEVGTPLCRVGGAAATG